MSMGNDLAREKVAEAASLAEKRGAEAKIQRYHSWLQGKLLPPLKIYIAPTAKCNLRCRYCVHSLEQYREDNYPCDLDEENVLRLTREGIKLGVKQFNIVCGGEPFLKRSLALAMMGEIVGGGAEGAITTNAVLLNREMLKEIVDMGWESLLISLDSHDEKTADSLRGKGTFRRCVRVLETLQELKKERNTHKPVVALNVVITPENYAHVPDILRFASRHGVWNVWFIPVTTHDTGMESLKLSREQTVEFQKIIQASLNLPEELNVYSTNLPSLLDTRITDETGNMIAVISSGQDSEHSPESELPLCFEPWCTIVIHPDGSLNPCQHNSRASHIGSRSLKDAWYNDSYLESMRKMHAKRTLPDFCQMCCSAVVVEHLKEQEAVKQRD